MIYVMRHAKPRSKIDQELGGCGKQQAQEVAACLREKGITFSIIRHSTLLRAQQTARIISDTSAVGPVEEEGLKEFDGVRLISFKAMELVSNVFPRAITRMLGWAYQQRIVQYRSVLDGIDSNPDEDALVVTHGAITRASLAVLCDDLHGVPPELGYTEYVVLQVEETQHSTRCYNCLEWGKTCRLT